MPGRTEARRAGVAAAPAVQDNGTPKLCVRPAAAERSEAVRLLSGRGRVTRTAAGAVASPLLRERLWTALERYGRELLAGHQEERRDHSPDLQRQIRHVPRFGTPVVLRASTLGADRSLYSPMELRFAKRTRTALHAKPHADTDQARQLNESTVTFSLKFQRLSYFGDYVDSRAARSRLAKRLWTSCSPRRAARAVGFAGRQRSLRSAGSERRSARSPQSPDREREGAPQAMNRHGIEADRSPTEGGSTNEGRARNGSQRRHQWLRSHCPR